MEHIPVMLHEAIEYLDVKPSGTYVDMTTGGGGHSRRILEKLTTGRLFCIDQDEMALATARTNLAAFSNVTFIHGNFADSKELLSGYNVGEADGILFDLGVSSFQFDEGERGFSYRFDALLDMRMDQTSSLSAKTIVNTYPAEEIADIIYRYGEEPFARPISRKIVEYRENRPIETTFELVEIIKSALPPLILRRKGHPAKQTFQALRIAVNDELGNLKRALAEAASLLAPKGRLVVITFHSLEDRICKEYFRKISTIEIPRDLPVILDEEPPFRLVLRHVLKPSEGEIETNNRAHSAKLRVIEKT